MPSSAGGDQLLISDSNSGASALTGVRGNSSSKRRGAPMRAARQSFRTLLMTLLAMLATAAAVVLPARAQPCDAPRWSNDSGLISVNQGAMAYDAIRRRTVLFGGQYFGLSAET